MTRYLSVVLISLLIILILPHDTMAQNPCEEIGADCRLMSAAEAKAFKERLLAVEALLPVPDADRYESDGAAEASTMPFVAESGFPNAVLTCRSWPAGCFPEDPYSTLNFRYLKKTKGEKSPEKPSDLLAASRAMQETFENRIEFNAWLRPYPYLEDAEGNPDADNVEKSPGFLSWETGEDMIDLHMVFGARTTKEEETLIGDRPAQNFAPLKSIELLISGPKTEVARLKNKINRQAFQALLGVVVK
jgi:hypothetical protein